MLEPLLEGISNRLGGRERLIRALFFLALLDLLAVWAYQRGAASELPYVPEPPRCSALAVLSADYDWRRDLPGPETARRLAYAYLLHRAGRADTLLLLGGRREGHPTTGAQIMARVLRAAGVRAVLLADTLSHDTPGNLQALLQHWQDQRWSSVGLISSDMHLWRARPLLDGQDSLLLLPYPAPAAAGLAARWGTVKRTHYEWAARLVQLLPEATRQNATRWFRQKTYQWNWL